jgi:hypothetical protein
MPKLDSLIPLQPKRFFPPRSRDSNGQSVDVPCLVSSTQSPTSRDIIDKTLQADSENEISCPKKSPNFLATQNPAGSAELKLPPTPSSRPKALLALPQKIRLRPAVLSSSLPSLTSGSIENDCPRPAPRRSVVLKDKRMTVDVLTRSPVAGRTDRLRTASGSNGPAPSKNVPDIISLFLVELEKAVVSHESTISRPTCAVCLLGNG